MPFKTINDHRISYLDTEQLEHEAQPDKLPFVMIHGLGSSENYYMPVIPFLTGHRCTALSTYGSAGSKSDGERLTLEGLAKDVIGMMDSLGISQAIIVGHSMGGTMACQIAATYPDRIVGIVCIGPVNPKSVNAEIFKSRIDTVLKDGMEPLANTIPYTATGSLASPLQRAMIRELLLSQDPKSYASHCQVIIDMTDPGFSTIKCPALVIAGEEDKSAPLEGCKHILDNFGSKQKHIKILEKVGHWQCVEAGERVAQEIASFASSLKP